MKNILTGIFSAYSANSELKAALPGGLHFEMAQQGTSLSYATFSLIDGRPDYMLAGEQYEIARIQFDIFSNTNALRQTAYDALIAVYDDARITATGYTPIIMERELQQFVRDGEQNEIFRAIVDFTATWKRIKGA